MTAFNYSKLQAKANALHDNAKDGTLKIDGQKYTFTFDRNEGVYVVTDEQGNTRVRYNTRKLTVARKWLREDYT